MRVTACGSSDVGKKRPHNEDAFLILAEEGLYCVADGMGGHASGEVASRIAVEEMAEFFRLTGHDEDATWPFRMDPAYGYDENRLLTGVKLANQRIHDRARCDERLEGMGTTLVAAHFPRSGAEVLVGHVGDSRAYLFRQGTLVQLTEDHSLLNDYIKMKHLSPEEIAAFPHKNVIVRALGMKDTVKVDTRFEVPQLNDVYILCTDGLSGPVSDNEMMDILNQHQEIKVATAKLIERANENGGPDNVTCVLVRWTQ
jgi:PPM family protein phosphatase